jgi:hypothetical protein
MWHLPASPKTQFDLLRDHPWIWRNDLASTGEVIAGAIWRTCLDLLAEPVDDQARSFGSAFRRRQLADQRTMAIASWG